ncbi:MAG: ABC transporter ATP-binding protein [Desulfofustis sp.]|jgi:ABC-type polysaccharide/polyol phosphate transport system ATPase subunit|nr:ABC transporter ATP-binding protein [Desulfofustis sp.]
MQPAITIDQVSKEYFLYRRPYHRVIEAFHPFGKNYHSSFKALSDISFQVGRGESIGIIGRNGSGKSTLLQIVCGNLQATSGDVAVNGRISALLELGSGFNPEFTGRENVFLNMAILGFSREESEARFDRIVEFADIGDFIDRPVKTYSSGMNIRLAFSTAISVDPEILVIDEALAVGDIFFQQKCVAHMKQVMQSCTILLVSHDMHAIANMCNRVVVLDQGRVVYEGEPSEAVSTYTKLIHSNLVQPAKRIETHELPETVQESVRAVAADFDSWPAVREKDIGGAGEIRIVRVSVTRNGEPISTIAKGDLVSVRLLVESLSAKDHVIMGYTIKDRVGNAIFGENSLCLEGRTFSLGAGYNLVSYEFPWPQIHRGSYTLTLGIGEGTHALSHVVQCWAHNIVSFDAITPDVPVHGIFNNPLCNLEISTI